MGGKPLTALNIAGFPANELDPEVLNQILLGGQSKAAEAGCTLVGGHTVQDPELKYGLAVTGLVHPDRIYTNAGAQPGDRLILSKKLGTGLIANAFKAGHLAEADLAEAVESMLALNKAAAENHARLRCPRRHRRHRLRPFGTRRGNGRGQPDGFWSFTRPKSRPWPSV